MKKLALLQENLQPGQVYRRSELARWSKSVDRHLKQLLADGSLRKLRNGLYYCPKQSVFGEVPADDYSLVRTFLKDDRFLLTSPNAYNALGLGTTQLYNKRVVYNHKRHGEFVLGGRKFDFRMKHYFPKQRPTQEFLLVDMVNNLDELAEDHQMLLQRVRNKVSTMDLRRLNQAVRTYGNSSTQKLFGAMCENDVY